MDTMKAIRIHEYGGPEVLRYEEAPIPEVRAEDVLVQVQAAGVNPVDWKIRQGYLTQRLQYELPVTLGWDVAGVVARVGSDVSGLSVGDAVYGRPDISRNGAYAEFISVRAQEVAPRPRMLDPIGAAAVPLACLTAWQALFEAVAPYSSAHLERGQTILIHGAAGGVGTFAVQLAKWRGARVIATGSARNGEFLHALGADVFVDYNVRPFEKVVSGVDVVLDTVGGDTQNRSWQILRPNGVLVSIVAPPSLEAARQRGCRAAYVFVQPNRRQLEEITGLIDSRRLRPILAESFRLREARRAHELSQAGHVRGKIVLIPHEG